MDARNGQPRSRIRALTPSKSELAFISSVSNDTGICRIPSTKVMLAVIELFAMKKRQTERLMNRRKASVITPPRPLIRITFRSSLINPTL